MGTLSLSKMGRLFWLGRYMERTYTTIRAIKPIADPYVDGREGDYAEYCRRLSIANTFSNTAEFLSGYLFDSANPNSVVSSLHYAYDNAIVLRETISSETLSYIHMAMYAMKLASQSEAAEVELQWVLDDIMAFRGSCCEQIADDVSRNIINTGTSVERVDLYLRLGYDRAVVKTEMEKLLNRLYKSQMEPDRARLNALVDMALDKDVPSISVAEQIACVEGLFPNV